MFSVSPLSCPLFQCLRRPHNHSCSANLKCVCVCVCACVRACVRACVCACMLHSSPFSHLSRNLSPQEAQRARTAPLHRWIMRNRFYPYPSKAQQKYFAVQAEMTPDQVSYWFANTRRKIKQVGLEKYSKGLYPDHEFQARSLRTTGAISPCK